MNTKWENKLKAKKIFLILTVLAIIALTLLMFAVYVKPAKAAEQITIVSHQGFLDSTGYYQVFARIKKKNFPSTTKKKTRFTRYEITTMERNKENITWKI